MKKTFVMAILAGAGCSLMLNSCSNSDEIVTNEAVRLDSELVTGIRVTLPDSPFAKETRTAHSIVSGAMHTDWQLGDTLGIYPIGGDQVAFPISEGEGTNTANFNGGAWALRAAFNYAAYYPFDRHNVFVQEDRLAFDYTGQVQDGDGSLNHLGAYDFLAAGATETNEDGSVDLTLNHLGCFVRMQLTIPEANTLKTVRIASNNVPFVVKGTVNLSSATPSISSVATSTYTEIKLENVAVEADETVTIYMMMAPVNLSGSILTFTVSGNGGVSYSQTLPAGKNMEAGNAYNYALALDKDDYQYVAVDLGLPSGLKWASFNVGATAPEEYGDYYAWGEVATKSDYSLATYEYFRIETGTDADGFDSEEQVWDNLGDISGTEYDVAHQKWGGSWRMPTQSEFDELYYNCTWKWGAKNTVYGYKVTGTNGNWIFLPAAGYRYYTSLINDGSYGFYWSSTPNNQSYAYSLYFYSSYIDPYNGNDHRYDGRSVRPVTE